MKYNKKFLLILLIIFTGILVFGCNLKSKTKSYEGSFFNSPLCEIKFTEEWNKLKREIQLDYNEQKCSIERFKIKISKEENIKIDEIFVSWKEKKNETILLSKIKINPNEQELNLYEREIDSNEDKKYKYEGITIENLMKIIDDIKLDNLIGIIQTKGEFYNVEFFGVFEQGEEIFEKNEQGQFTGSEVDTDTGKEFKNYNHHKYVINDNGELKELKSDEKYLLKSRALRLVIVPMEKVNENSYRGSIEVEVINLLSN